MALEENKQGWQAPTKLWNGMFIGIFFVNMVMNLGESMSNNLLSLYAKSLGASPDRIGLLMGMFAGTSLILRFISGPAMDCIKRTKLLCLASCILATAFFGYGFAAQLSGLTGIDTVTILQCFRLMQGCGKAFANACCLVVVSDVLPKDKFASGIGIYAVAQTVSYAIGPACGIWIRDLIGYENAYRVFGTILIIALFIILRIKTPPREPKKFVLKLDSLFALEAIIPAIITFFIGSCTATINSFIVVYAEEHAIANASFFFTVYAGTMVVTRPMLGRLIDRFGFSKVVLPALCMTLVSLGLIAFCNSLIMLLIAGAINACGVGAVFPALQSLCMRAVPPERRGAASSAYFIGFDSSTLLSPWICGIVADHAGYAPVMWLPIVIMILCGMTVAFVFRGRITNIEENFRARNTETAS